MPTLLRRLLVVISAGGILLVPVTAASAAGPPIRWQSCGDSARQGFQCARIRVPLDYGNPHGKRLGLALIRHRAAKPMQRLGTIFYEPGGPGVGGTTFLPPFIGNFPAALRARFDIVSWDPRGVGASTAVQCFPSRAAEDSFLSGSPTRTVDGFPVGAAQMETWIDRYRRFGARCRQRNGSLLKHISTVDTVRDLDLMRRRIGGGRINYLGTSYGTIVGAVYANMFPRRVRTMILDGVVNPVAWTRPRLRQNGGRFLPGGMRFRSDIETGKTLRAFLDLCGSTGITRCAFSAGSPRATRAKFHHLLPRLPVTPASGRMTYAQAVTETVHQLYITDRWKAQASRLEDLWEHGPSLPIRASGSSASPAASERYGGEEQELAIACGEVPSPPAASFPGADALARERSGVAGPYWAWDYEPCSTWPARSAHRFTGPWNRRTAGPVLVIGNTFDPATPLRGAKVMAKRLARARLLRMDGYGHTALLNPSSCVNRIESRYLIRRTLPRRGVTCAQDVRPFGNTPNEKESAR